jgi:hypothetical protein
MQVAKSEMTMAKYNTWLDGQISGYYTKYVRSQAVFTGGGCSAGARADCQRVCVLRVLRVRRPQVKAGKIAPYFHAMAASSLLSFGAMYPYALGKISTAARHARWVPVHDRQQLIRWFRLPQRSTSRRTRPASSGASRFSLDSALIAVSQRCRVEAHQNVLSRAVASSD